MLRLLAAAVLSTAPSLGLADARSDFCRESLRTSYIELATFHVRVREAVADARMASVEVPEGTDELASEMEAISEEWQARLIQLAQAICAPN